MLHAGCQRNRISPRVTLDTFGLSCGARCVQGIAGVGTVHPHTIYSCLHVGLSHRLVVMVALGVGAVGDQASIHHQNGLRLMLAQCDGLIQQGLVGHQFPATRTGIGTDDQTWCCVINAGCQRMRGKTTKDHGMNGTYACTSQHGKGCFSDHGHVNQYPVALVHTQGLQDGRHSLHFLAQLTKCVDLFNIRLGRHKNQGG